MKKTSRRAGLLILSLLTAPTFCFSQVATGIPPFGSFSGGPIDVVNNANLNAHISIPVIGKAGRGINFSYTLTYDSSVWIPIGSSWQPANSWGWNNQTNVVTGYVTYSTKLVTCNHGADDQMNYYNWKYYDMFGVPHSFGNVATSDGGCGGSQTGLGTTTDGSGYTISVIVTSATVYSRSGDVLIGPELSTSGAGTATDSNGNQITVSTSEVFTDTLGTTALTVAGSGTPSSPLTFTYTSPSAQAVAYTMKFSTYTVQTNFACSGISEYGPTSQSLVSEIDLPDFSTNSSEKYTFGYEATPGHAGNVTGRLASVTLPAGGTISYTYTGGNSGIECVDGSAAGLTRQTPDGTWTYARSGSAPSWITTITDPTTPQGNQTVLNFQGIYETQRQVYQGTTSGTLLRTVITCYNGNTTNCATTAVNLPISQQTIFNQWPGGLQSRADSFFNSYGLLTERDEYDYGNPNPGSLQRKTLITYATLGNNIVDRPATVTVQNGAGVTKAQTTFSYDETSVTATSGTPQHVAVSGSRGNPTTVSYLVQGSTRLSRTFQYYDTGTIQSATDVNGAVTTNNYGTGSCGNSFVTSVSLPLNLSRSQAWNCTGGVVTSVTDENGKITNNAYNDPYFWRPASVTDPASNVTTFTYTGQTAVESTLNFNGGASTVDILRSFDGLGRIHVEQQKQSPTSSSFDSVETDYDSLGRPSRFTMPYSGTAGQTNSSVVSTAANYDAMSRPTLVTDGGGSTLSTSYSQNDILQTTGPAPSGENTKKRQYEYDGLGRLTSACELTSLSGSGTCAQNTSQTGYWTKYIYDALNDVTGVTQNAQASSSYQQTRSYSFDGLGRLTSEVNAETGTTNYVYDSDATCGNSTGDLVKRTDAVGNTTCYAYDSLHRVTSVTYSGSYAPSTPNKYFVYDSATVNGATMANAKGHLAEAYTATSKITDEGFSYSARGEVTDVYQSTPHSSGYYHVSAIYWAHGGLNQLSGLPGLPTITYGVDGEGRPYSTSAASGQNPVSSTSYNVFSEPTQANFGSSDNDAFSYDANTGRMTQYQFKINNQSDTGALTWNANGTLKQLSITDALNSANSQTCNYTHDDLARIATANCGSAFSGTYTYDAFGNINKTGTFSFQPTYSPTTNRMSSLPGYTPTYDLNGNVLGDSLHSYTWDAEGRPVTIDTVGVTYDALGRMVEQNRSGTYTEIAYAPMGNKLALMSGQTLQKAFVALPGGATAVYNANGLAYYRHSDWLRSSRLASTPSRGMYSDTAYGPFGESYAQSGTTDLSFTGQNQDTVSALYDFLFREYGVQGRWPSPDPAGLAAVDVTDPRSWNRYAYVLNNPLILVDPLGLEVDEWWQRYITLLMEMGCTGDDILWGRPCSGQPKGGDERGSNRSGGGGSGGLTLGVRAPNQTFGQCMQQNASNYSLAGLTDLAFGANGKISGNLVANVYGGNNITSIYFAFDGTTAQSASNAASTAAGLAPNVTATGMGSVVTYGRRTSDIMALNIAGKGGLPRALSASSAGTKSFLGKILGGVDLALKTAIDTGFTAAEAVGCAIPR